MTQCKEFSGIFEVLSAAVHAGLQFPWPFFEEVVVLGHFWKRLWNLTIFGRRDTWPFLEEVVVLGHF